MASPTHEPCLADGRAAQTPRDLILGAYFAGKRHPQHGQSVLAGSFDYFADWFHSICRLGLNAVLLHDHLDDRFIAKHEQWFKTLGGTARGGSFAFQRVSLGAFTAGDERFFHVRDYLQDPRVVAATRHVFVVDVADAWFRRDPFALVRRRGFWDYLDLTGLLDALRVQSGREPDPFLAPGGVLGWLGRQAAHFASRQKFRLFLGREDTRIADNPWMLKHFDRVYGRRFTELGPKPVLNCGIIGGTRADVVLLLHQVCAEMQNLVACQVLNDMAVFNKILHQHWDGLVYSGGALNSPWKRWRKHGRHAIFHK